MLFSIIDAGYFASLSSGYLKTSLNPVVTFPMPFHLGFIAGKINRG
jgi:hypothetical protein